MPVQRINTIAELQAEQDRIVDKMRITRNEFSRSFSSTTNVGRDFLLKNILLPAGAIGLGVFVAKKFAGEAILGEKSPAHVEYQASIGEDNSLGWFPKLMLVALPVVQQLFLKVKSDEDTQAASGNTNGQTNEPQAGWLSTIVPLAIPMVQQYFLKKSEQSEGRAMTVDMEGGEVVEGTFSAKKEGSNSIFESLYKLLPVVLPLVQQYFARTASKTVTDKSAKPQYDNDGQYAVAAT
jgi:hypothetical protein